MERRGEGRLTWNFNPSYYFAYRGDLLITVPTEIFHNHFAAFLHEQGVEMKSLHQLQQELQEAWDRQNALKETLLKDLMYWIALDGQGVKVQVLQPHHE